MTAAADPCDRCVRRSWLVARLAAHLERRRAERSAIRCVLALADEQLLDALGGGRRAVIRAELDRLDPGAVLKAWKACGSLAICRCDPYYPAALNDLPDPPAVLHLLGADAVARGLLAPRDGAGGRVAIVGARRASTEGVAVARELARGCAAAGLTVISGMALGIDAAAHEGALDVDGSTVAVLACGPERAYPPSRRRLHGQLVARGLVISELPPGTAPFRWSFPARNRIIAALAGLTVVVEAAERSGSLITAEIALELGRGVGAVPGPVRSWRSRGANAMLRDGAQVIRDARDVLDDLCGVSADAACPVDPLRAGLRAELRELLLAIEAGARTPSACARSPADVAGVLEGFAELELLGLITRRAGGRYFANARSAA